MEFRFNDPTYSWFASRAVTLAELLAGVRRLPDAKRRSALAASIDTALEPYRETRAIPPFDGNSAQQYAGVLVGSYRLSSGTRSSTSRDYSLADHSRGTPSRIFR